MGQAKEEAQKRAASLGKEGCAGARARHTERRGRTQVKEQQKREAGLRRERGPEPGQRGRIRRGGLGQKWRRRWNGAEGEGDMGQGEGTQTGGVGLRWGRGAARRGRGQGTADRRRVGLR